MNKKSTKKAIRINDNEIIKVKDIQDVVDSDDDIVSQFTYRSMLFELVHKEFEEKEAESIWLELLKHYDKINDALNRDVGILVASLDYLSNITKALDVPTIIETTEIESISKLAIYDGLTKLYTKRVFGEFLDKHVDIYKRNKEIFTLVLFDLDDFKIVNDGYGHLEGDLVLRKIGSIVNENIRSSDIAFRYGGDEFAIILPDTNLEHASTLVEKLRLKIEMSFSNKDYSVTASFGLDEMKDIYNKREITLNADHALYQSKETGKNKVTLYS